MESARYPLAALLLILIPAGMSMWFVIHPFARFWRRRGPLVTYSVVVLIAALVAVPLYRWHEAILAVDFGFSWWTTGLGVVVLLLAILIERSCRRQMTPSTLLGLPEVSEQRESRLLREGIYGRLRHPRYVGVLLEITAVALFVNYLAAYVLVVLMIPVLYVTVLLEERELLQRFGEDYAAYMREVPRFLPK